MIVLTDKDRSKLKSLGIKALVLFGCQAQGVADEKSDYDFFVIGKKSMHSCGLEAAQLHSSKLTF